MSDFKTFVADKISYIASHFKRKALLLRFDGTPLSEIDLSFESLSDEYLQLEEPPQEQPQQGGQIQQTGSMIRIDDHDLLPLLDNFNQEWTGKLILADQNITDQTILRLADLLKAERCRFTGLNFSGNRRITFIGGIALADALRNNQLVRKLLLSGVTLEREGANRLIELISVNRVIVEYDFGNIGNDSLLYLAAQLENPHCVENLAFDPKKKWQADGKKAFDTALRRNPHSKQLTSITVSPQDPEEHYNFVAELSLLCSKNRALRIKQRENDHKSKSLNPEHPKYYDPDNHSVNAYKFSVKSYLTNVFGSMLDEGLYFLEKERRNSLREEAIFSVSKVPINKTILQDICTSDGSIMVLAQYLLKKIKSPS